MNKPLPIQLIALGLLAVLIGGLNNLRSSTHIDWVRHWPKFSSLAVDAEKESTQAPKPAADSTPVAGEGVEGTEMSASGADEVAILVQENMGITDVDLETAYKLHRYASDFTFWIDARDPDLFGKGRIQGSNLLYFYEMNSYLPEIESQIAAVEPLALVIYCKGKTCTDSHHLAEDFFNKGYNNIFVYKDGYDDWLAAGYPVEGVPVEQAAEPVAEKPPGMYLEHVVRDMVPFLFGFFLLTFWKRASKNRNLLITASVFAGAFFVWASLPKLQGPLEFAKTIWNYDIAPGAVINLSALFMPGLELICGLGLIFGFMRKGSSVFVSGMLVIFIVAVSYNVLRGHDFNCGCTSEKTILTEAYLTGWNDKLTLLMRDVGLLVMSLLAFRIDKKE